MGLRYIPASLTDTGNDVLGNPVVYAGTAEGHNNSENLLLQPEAYELYAVSQNFTTNPWFSGTSAVAYGYDIIEADYEYLHYWFADVFSKAPTKFNNLVYGTAQTDLEKLAEALKFVDANEPLTDSEGSEITDSEGNTIYALKEGVM